ncbi:MAG TPA: polyprenyl synthetase family protein [Anaerolineae bacterium]
MNAILNSAALRETVLGLPDVADWPEVEGLFDAQETTPRMDWQLPTRACLAVGGTETAALPAVAAIACLQISIILVDDILDNDPRGEYHRLGEGRAANIALAFEAAALDLLARAPVDGERRALACAAVARAALTTARGQDLDVQNLRGEENYWRVVKTKSTPFYGVAFQSGALLGGASPQVAQGLYEVGVLLGEMVQVFDDLLDAFATPANPDWREGRNNLALLYASTAEHPQRDVFRGMLGHVEDAASLQAAQQILVTCGAVSYCVYLLARRVEAVRRLLRSLNLPDPEPVWFPIAQEIKPLTNWLERLGLPVPAELAGETL